MFFGKSNCRTKPGNRGTMTRYEGLVCIYDSRLADTQPGQGGGVSFT